MDIDKIDAEIGERVHQVMWRKRVSQRELARALGIDPAAASLRLRGLIAWKFTDLVIVARLLDVGLGELIPEEGVAGKEASAESRCAPPWGQRSGRRRVPALPTPGRTTLRPVWCAS